MDANGPIFRPFAWRPLTGDRASRHSTCGFSGGFFFFSAASFLPEAAWNPNPSRRTPWFFDKALVSGLWDQGVSPTTSVIQVGISPFIWGVSLWEALFVVSQKWIPFPTALLSLILGGSWLRPQPEARLQDQAAAGAAAAASSVRKPQTRRNILCMVAKSVRTTLTQWETIVCWCLQGNHHSRVFWVVLNNLWGSMDTRAKP